MDSRRRWRNTIDCPVIGNLRIAGTEKRVDPRVVGVVFWPALLTFLHLLATLAAFRPSQRRSGHKMDWRHRAICRDEDPELFFPVGNSGPALLQIAEAKAVCQRCPVTSECLTWALETGQDAGVWGAMSEDERRALKRRRARARARSM